MIRSLRDWVDDRTGLGNVVDAMLLEHIPGGAKWRYVWGSALAIVFSIQLITGVLLMTAYSPGDTTAWGSVYFIQYEMDFGWLIRGLHHFGSQTMVVLLGVHMLQVVIAGAHLKPREVNWWLGLGLAGVVLGLSLTGYLLPWDQKGYYATQVATNIASGLPVIGQPLQKIIVGGPAYGNHTLTRFFGLHVAILPGILIALLIAHIWVFRRHGITTPANAKGDGWFWPDQAFKDMVVGLVIFAIMLGLVIYGWGNKIEPTVGSDGAVAQRSFYDKIAHAGRDGLGANLDAPADPNTPYPARPEWYFLSLFQFLKYFKGTQELIGTVVVPGGIVLILFLLPLFGQGKFRTPVRIASVLLVVALLGGAAYLTAQAWVEDQHPDTFQPNAYVVDPKTGMPEEDPATGTLKPNPSPGKPRQPYYFLRDLVDAKRYSAKDAWKFQVDMEAADKRAKRAIQLASEGIPAAGPRYLLRNDPMTKGKDLFKQHCASCHNYHEHNPDKPENEWMNKKPTASDLTGFGTKEWILGLLKSADDPKYFGSSHLKDGSMAGFSKDKRKQAKSDPKIDENFETIAAWLASHPRGSDMKAPGFVLYKSTCGKCHGYKSDADEGKEGPDFYGYGDAQWLRDFLVNPASPLKYGTNNRMPAFRDLNSPTGSILEEMFKREKEAALKEAKDPDEKKAIEASHKVVNLSDLDRELIIRFVTGDGRVVFGGEPIGAAPAKK